MRGAIAAGHSLTAEAGARVLAEGGNAVDACIAAAFASWVTESPLTGPGGGGFMLVHRGHDRGARLLDFFVDVPGRGLEDHERRPMDDVDVSFGDSNPIASGSPPVRRSRHERIFWRRRPTLSAADCRATRRRTALAS